MTQSNTALLAKAPPGRHLCQFHGDSESLSRSVALFAGSGLRRGDAVVIFATSKHTELFLRDLERTQLDPEAFRQSGHLLCLDAEEMLREITHEGQPDWHRFRQAAAAMLERLPTSRKATRLYGEMVSILWHLGRPEAAIRLEEYWNELQRHYPFVLLCGYLLDGLHSQSYSGPLHEIGRTHSDVLPTEDDDRLRVAVDAASEEVLGMSFSLTLSFSGHEQNLGEHRLPSGRRTMLWLQRNMPGTSGRILERARHHFHRGRAAAG